MSNEKQLKELVTKLYNSLSWYIANDDTIEFEDDNCNEYWLKGKKRAEDLIKEVQQAMPELPEYRLEDDDDE